MQEGRVTLEVTSASPGTVTQSQGLKVGLFTVLDTIHVVEETPANPREPEGPLVDIDLSKASLSATQKADLQSLLNRFAHVFAHQGEPPGRTTVTKHDIRVNAPTIHQPLRRLPASLKGVVHQKSRACLPQG